MSKRKAPPKKPAPKAAAPRRNLNGKPKAVSVKPTLPGKAAKPTERRLLPHGDELKSLYQRYTHGSRFDEHDKAFYFVLDVGGLSRAKQLLAHVEEVLSELEEFRA